MSKQTTSSFRDIVKDINDTYMETHRTLVWGWTHILSPYGRRKTVIATVTLLASMLISMGVTYVAKEVIDAIASNNRTYASYLTLLGIGGTLVIARLLLAFQEFARELGWNDNYHSVVVNLSRLFFARTAGEMVAENNEVGAEQVESAKDRIQNILYMVLFEGPTVVIGMIAATILMFSVDAIAGGIVTLMIIGNIAWFLYCNSLIDAKMEKIDKAFRRANRRMIEKWNLSLSTKTNGVEDKVIDQISHETKEPLEEDKRVWAYWFIPIDLIRGVVNIAAMVSALLYGLVVAEWSSGDFAAVFFWFSMTMDRFGYLGHLMRHLTSQVVRVRAVREVLQSEPEFRHDVGILYQPKHGGL